MSESSLAIQQEPLACKPFLKWAGGKTQLLPEILKRVPETFATFHEPFIGAGAVFFALQPQHAFLSDINSELINGYCVVRDELPLLIEWLKKYSYDEKEFYRLRALDRGPEYELLPSYVRAARLIYLNKSCFNGLYRVNKSGYFNTPFGRYTNPKILDAANLKLCSQALRGIHIQQEPFESVLSRAQKGDFVYFDPPYPPVSDSSYFTSYTDKGFSWTDQMRLQEVCQELNSRGVFFLLSNAGIKEVRNLYKDFSVDSITAKRAINSKGNNRGDVCEFLIRNY